MRARRVCAVDDCDKPNHAYGYCSKHAMRFRTHGSPHASPRVDRNTQCAVAGCERQPSGKYCETHRARLRRTGTTDDPSYSGRYLLPSGYWLVRVKSHPLARQDGYALAHRVALYDKIGPGEHPCHWCGVCVSWDMTYPDHPLGLVTDHLDEVKTNNQSDNLVPSCAKCNFARSSRWVKQRRAAGA